MPDLSYSQQLSMLQDALADFAGLPLEEAATAFFATLGYPGDRTQDDIGHNPDEFLASMPESFNRERAHTRQWRRCAFLFQLTNEEIPLLAVEQRPLVTATRYARDDIESFAFLALELTGENWSRTALAAITREFNRAFAMPAILLFKYGRLLSLAVIDRRLHLRDANREVLDSRITVIKDVRYADPHRAHLDILAGLAFANLGERHRPGNFRELYDAWIAALSIQALNQRFFIEIRNWFYWARLFARFPEGAQKDAEDRDSEALIRLLTRLVFCWFLTEKRLIPDALFSMPTIAMLLRDWSAADIAGDDQGRYYKAILQNLFFATLNTPVAERKFRTPHTFQGRNKHYGDQRYFRHVDLFQETARVEEFYQTIPFLNGGLFEMLDEVPHRDHPEITQEKRVDGFSDTPGKQPLVPDFLFFGDERPVAEIAALLGESAIPRVRGLFRIFRDYKFTIEENTPFEEDIALDPELLGRVFENLLAAVNPETGAVARKSTGSFYTPREIVNYMVEEALVRHLLTVLEGRGTWPADFEGCLRELVAEGREAHRFNEDQAALMVDALSRLRILDPACGSGAFPMGLLQRLVQVLRKLDPGNERWKAAKLAALPLEMREKAEEVFSHESFDYTRKLELIKDCIHGVDIQPAAIQISKLRFFLSLVIEQKSNAHIRPLPNLETKFVCANALLGLPRRAGWALFEQEIVQKEADLLSNTCDKKHPKPYIEAKDISRWTYAQKRWLEWGTERSPLLLARPTFEGLYEVPEKLIAADVSGAENRAAYDLCQIYHSHTLISFVPWHYLHGVRNNSLKKTARYRGEKPRPDLPKREELEATSRRFNVKYLLGVMNSGAARDYLRANRRSNTDLYPDDWKKLPIPDAPPEQQAPIVALVEQILTLRRANPRVDIAELEAEIDRKVAGLYGVASAPDTEAVKH